MYGPVTNAISWVLASRVAQLLMPTEPARTVIVVASRTYPVAVFPFLALPEAAGLWSVPTTWFPVDFASSPFFFSRLFNRRALNGWYQL